MILEVFVLLEQQSLHIKIDSIFELKDIAHAHERLDEGKATGKILLRIQD